MKTAALLIFGVFVVAIILIVLIKLRQTVSRSSVGKVSVWKALGVLVGVVFAIPVTFLIDIKTFGVLSALMLSIAHRHGGDYIHVSMLMSTAFLIFSLALAALSILTRVEVETAGAAPVRHQAGLQVALNNGVWGAIGLVTAFPMVISSASLFWKASPLAQEIYPRFSISRPIGYGEALVFAKEKFGESLPDFLMIGDWLDRGQSTIIIIPSDYVTWALIGLFPASVLFVIGSIVKTVLDLSRE